MPIEIRANKVYLPVGTNVSVTAVRAASNALTRVPVVTGATSTPTWQSSPPAGVCPAPSGPVVGQVGQFDTGILAQNEVWDNFDGALGSNPDSRLWLEDTIPQGGTQTYDPANSFLDGASSIVLEATTTGQGIYRSGRFTSRTKFNMQYGWCAARIRFPSGQGFWPAFWLLLQGLNTTTLGYGEIDIMEFFGPAVTYATNLHFGTGTPVNLSSNIDVPTSHGNDASTGFKTYWMMWEPTRIQIGVNELIMATWGPAQRADWDNMQQPFYYIVNFAVAPDWLPAPVPSAFPARMYIDWIWYKPLNLF